MRTYIAGARAIGGLDTRLSGVVFKCVGVWAERLGVRILSTPLFYWLVWPWSSCSLTLPPQFSQLQKLGYKRE